MTPRVIPVRICQIISFDLLTTICIAENVNTAEKNGMIWGLEGALDWSIIKLLKANRPLANIPTLFEKKFLPIW